MTVCVIADIFELVAGSRSCSRQNAQLQRGRTRSHNACPYSTIVAKPCGCHACSTLCSCLQVWPASCWASEGTCLRCHVLLPTVRHNTPGAGVRSPKDNVAAAVFLCRLLAYETRARRREALLNMLLHGHRPVLNWKRVKWGAVLSGTVGKCPDMSAHKMYKTKPIKAGMSAFSAATLLSMLHISVTATCELLHAVIFALQLVVERVPEARAPLVEAIVGADTTGRQHELVRLSAQPLYQLRAGMSAVGAGTVTWNDGRTSPAGKVVQRHATSADGPFRLLQLLVEDATPAQAHVASAAWRARLLDRLHEDFGEHGFANRHLPAVAAWRAFLLGAHGVIVAMGFAAWSPAQCPTSGTASLRGAGAGTGAGTGADASADRDVVRDAGPDSGSDTGALEEGIDRNSDVDIDASSSTPDVAFRVLSTVIEVLTPTCVKNNGHLKITNGISAVDVAAVVVDNWLAQSADAQLPRVVCDDTWFQAVEESLTADTPGKSLLRLLRCLAEAALRPDADADDMLATGHLLPLRRMIACVEQAQQFDTHGATLAEFGD